MELDVECINNERKFPEEKKHLYQIIILETDMK